MTNQERIDQIIGEIKEQQDCPAKRFDKWTIDRIEKHIMKLRMEAQTRRAIGA